MSTSSSPSFRNRDDLPSLNVQSFNKSNATLLLLDFDGTLTTEDTLHLVAQAGYNRDSSSSTSISTSPVPWSSIVDAYLTDYSAHKSTYQPQATLRTTPTAELAWLDSLASIEGASFARACEAGIWDGLTSRDMEEAGRQCVRKEDVKLRTGWEGLVRWAAGHDSMAKWMKGGQRTKEIEDGKIKQGGSEPSMSNIANTNVERVKEVSIAILSVNWSASFIRGVMSQAIEASSVTPPENDTVMTQLCQNIYANELPSVLSSSITNSNQHHPIRTSGDKVKILRRLREEKQQQQQQSKPQCDEDTYMCQNENTPRDVRVIYIGDSTTDLGCLLEADIGFIIGDPDGKGSLIETCRRIGVHVRNVWDEETSVSDLDGQGHGDGDDGQNTRKTLWSVRDFEDVVRWLEKK